MDLLNRAKNDSNKSINEDPQERQKQLKTAREIISNAISEDNGKKVHRICMGRLFEHFFPMKRFATKTFYETTLLFRLGIFANEF